MIAGVAAGIADYFGLDLSLVRVIIVVTAIVGGFGLVLYIVMWILVPDETTGHAIVEPKPADGSANEEE